MNLCFQGSAWLQASPVMEGAYSVTPANSLRSRDAGLSQDHAIRVEFGDLLELDLLALCSCLESLLGVKSMREG